MRKKRVIPFSFFVFLGMVNPEKLITFEKKINELCQKLKNLRLEKELDQKLSCFQNLLESGFEFTKAPRAITLFKHKIDKLILELHLLRTTFPLGLYVTLHSNAEVGDVGDLVDHSGELFEKIVTIWKKYDLMDTLIPHDYLFGMQVRAKDLGIDLKDFETLYEVGYMSLLIGNRGSKICYMEYAHGDVPPVWLNEEPFIFSKGLPKGVLVVTQESKDPLSYVTCSLFLNWIMTLLSLRCILNYVEKKLRQLYEELIDYEKLSRKSGVLKYLEPLRAIEDKFDSLRTFIETIRTNYLETKRDQISWRFNSKRPGPLELDWEILNQEFLELSRHVSLLEKQIQRNERNTRFQMETRIFQKQISEVFNKIAIVIAIIGLAEVTSAFAIWVLSQSPKLEIFFYAFLWTFIPLLLLALIIFGYLRFKQKIRFE